MWVINQSVVPINDDQACETWLPDSATSHKEVKAIDRGPDGTYRARIPGLSFKMAAIHFPSTPL